MQPLYHMAPAPPRIHSLIPIDLGQFDESYLGWKVVVNPDAPLSVNEALAMMEDSGIPAVAKIQAMYDWVSACFLDWNFTRMEGERVIELKKPGEGGEREINMGMIRLLSEAYALATKPSKN